MESSYPISDLCIKDLVDVSSMLKNIIDSSFGPHCQPVLITTNTGQVVFTKDCYTVLSSLSLSHPAARCILESIFLHARVYGDGCKTIILYLAELFREIEKNYLKLQCHTEINGQGGNISTSLRKFVAGDLYKLCNCMRDFVIGDQFFVDGVNCDLKLLKQVLVTILNGSFPKDVVDHFGTLVSNFTFSLNSSQKNRSFLKLIFQNCLHIFPNKSYMDSHLTDGLCLNGRSCHPFLKCETKAKFVIILCPLEEEVTDGQTEYFMQMPSDKLHHNIMTHKKSLIELFVNGLKRLGIALMITSQKIPDFALHICKSVGIDVFSCVEQEDIEFISYLTGTSPITSVQDDLETNEVIFGHVESYEMIVYSGKEILKLTCLEKSSNWQVNSLILHAPSDGLAQQLKLLMRKCFRALGCLFEGFNQNFADSSSLFSASQNPPSTTSGEEGLERNARVSISPNIICGGGYFEFLLSHFMEKKFDEPCPALTKTWAGIVSRMLQSIPRTLFSNLNANKSHGASNFITVRENAKKQLVGNASVGFDSNGVLSNAVTSGVVDILSVKVACLHAAMDLAVMLLKIDTVVGVKRLLQVQEAPT